MVSDAAVTAAVTSEIPVFHLNMYYAALLTVLIAVLVPIWLVDYPGMVDYPNHLVRCYIIAHYQDNPLWQQRYFLVHDPFPNLAIDLVVVPLLRFFPLIVCGKLFLSLSATLYVVGCSAVGRAVIGKPNWLALICAFTFYNSSLFYGFVNYIFGVGVFLCVFAFWLQVRNAMSPVRSFFLCLLSLVAFLVHLSSIVMLSVACCTITLLDFVYDRKARSLIVKLIWLACPLLFVGGFAKKHSGEIGTIDWGTPIEKLITLLGPVRSYSVAMDLGLIFLLLLCACAMLKGVKVHSTVLVSLVFFALYLVTPRALWTVSSVDARYIIPGYLLLVLSTEPRWGRWQKAALAVALVGMVIHTAGITASWLTINQRGKQVLAMGEVLPPGAHIYALRSDTVSVETKLDRGFIHLIQFWTISHDSDISTLFALSGQEPLVFREPACVGVDRAACFSRYDYVWTYDPPPTTRQILLGIATPVSVWEKVTLWRVTAANGIAIK
jgi:hypothetical protein